jgi:SAM-dependent methyltransferase
VFVSATSAAPAEDRASTAAAGSCCICGEGPLQPVRGYRTQSSHGARLFRGGRLARCARCSSVQLTPRPDAAQLGRYYEADYRRGPLYGKDVADPATFPRDNLFYYNRGRSVAEKVAEYVTRPDARILDVGTGYGHVLHALGERYPDSDRLAIEFSDAAVDHLRSIGVRVEVAPVEEVLGHLDQTFDVIALSHVLEHLLDPVRVLQLLRLKLDPDGILYIEVPNIEPDLLNRYPDHPWAPRYDEPHVTFFSRETLTAVLDRAGFDVVFCDTAGPAYRDVSALRFRLPPFRVTVQRLIPRRLFTFLRGLRATSALRVKDREEAFYRYGGFRIWIRAVARPARV